MQGCNWLPPLHHWPDLCLPLSPPFLFSSERERERESSRCIHICLGDRILLASCYSCMSSDSINRNFISFFFGEKMEQTRSDLKAEHQHRKPRSFVRTKKYPLIYDFIFFHPWKRRRAIYSVFPGITVQPSHGTVQVYNHMVTQWGLSGALRGFRLGQDLLPLGEHVTVQVWESWEPKEAEAAVCHVRSYFAWMKT